MSKTSKVTKQDLLDELRALRLEITALKIQVSKLMVVTPYVAPYTKPYVYPSDKVTPWTQPQITYTVASDNECVAVNAGG